MKITIPLKPIPASRPRVTRWGVYYSKTYKNWMAEAERIVPVWKDAPWCFPVQANTLIAVPRAKTSQLVVPVGDGDNFEKAVFDLLQKKGYLEDDKWITSATWRKRFLPYGEVGFTMVELTPETEEIDL